MPIEIVPADYSNAVHAKDITYLLNLYAQDPMGGGQPLSKNVLNKLVKELSKRAYASSFLAYIDQSPVGLINCFEGFSTFKCKPLINIHDIYVHKAHRGLGVCRLLVEEVEALAVTKGCCKLTLEVLDGNVIAKKAYANFGFSAYELSAENGTALFWEKSLKSLS